MSRQTAAAISADTVAELRVKQLEFLQTIICRVSGHAVTLKNFCITLSTAIVGLALTTEHPLGGLLALFPIVVIAILDAQYLRMERRYRGLYNKVRQEDWHTLPSFDVNLHGAPPSSFHKAMFSWSILSFYAPFAVGVVALTLILEFFYG